jgi:exodeoxyribonuclease (lambda-induced)
MTAHADLLTRLSTHEARLGFNPVTVEQQTFDWFKMRLGVITASKASILLMKSGSLTRQTYMSELVGEIATGSPVQYGSFKQMEWGNDHEDAAREMYQFITGNAVQQIPFCYGKDMRTGCSPDGITDHGRGAEIKCPWTTAVHIQSLADNVIKKDYIAQIDFSMWVTKLEAWDFCSFDPRMRKNNLHRIEKVSGPGVKLFDDAVPQFIEEMDRMLAAVGFEFGDQW